MIISLLTDYGLRDPALASAKAEIAQFVPEAVIADLSHHVPLHSQRDAAHMLAKAYRYFPTGTVHIVPVSPFVGKAPAMVLAMENGHYFIAPDNGVLPLALQPAAINGARLCQRYAKPYNTHTWLADAGKLAQKIYRGVILPDIPTALQPLPLMPPPQISDSGAECRVTGVDRYGNITLGITAHEFHELTSGREFRIETTKKMAITQLSHHYNDVPYGQPLCRFSKAGVLQIAVNHGNAADLLQLDTANPGKLYYSTVRIYV
jgi:hypothetical protein